jgi:hypothetical protein
MGTKGRNPKVQGTIQVFEQVPTMLGPGWSGIDDLDANLNLNTKRIFTSLHLNMLLLNLVECENK